MVKGEQLIHAGVAVAGCEWRGAPVKVRDHDLDGEDRRSQAENRDRRSLEASSSPQGVPDAEAGDDRADLLL